MEWKDETTYSRGDKERIPSVLVLNMDDLRIVIHRILHCEGWYLTVPGLRIENLQLKLEDLEEAKTKGLEILIERIEKLEETKDKLFLMVPREYQLGDKVLFSFFNDNYVGVITKITKDTALIRMSGFETIVSVGVTNIIKRVP